MRISDWSSDVCSSDLTIGLRDLAIILRALVDILDHQADRRAGRLALEDARQDAHLIGLLPLRRVARLAGTALVEKGLDVGLRQRQPRWATVDDRAERRPVAFTPGRESKDASEAVETHARGVLSMNSIRLPQGYSVKKRWRPSMMLSS